MSKADELFKELGYEISNGRYKGKIEDIDIKCPNNKWSSNIKFKLGDNKLQTFIVYYDEHSAGNIDIYLWKAINEKVKELGWEI